MLCFATMKSCLALAALGVLAIGCGSARNESTSVPTVNPEVVPSEPIAAAQPGTAGDLWLEEVEGDRALAWVREQNTRSQAVLEGDARFAGLQSDALAILNANDRIPYPRFSGGEIRNFWQDAEHVRGIVRRTTLASYRTAEPRWETLLDVDAISATEGKNWVYKGASCLLPERRFCLVSLSDGGEDATTIREYDMRERAFVEGGFVLPESKGQAEWLDRDTLLVARDFGEGSMTTSGYPRTVRRLSRGQTIADAREVFAGESTDVSVYAHVLRDADGRTKGVMFGRGVTFFESEYFLAKDDGTTERITLPRKVQFEAFTEGQMVWRTREDWTSPSGTAFSAGDLFSQSLDALKRSPSSVPCELIFHPGERDSIDAVSDTRSRLLVAVYENLRASVYSYRRQRAAWTRTRLSLPENASLSIDSTSYVDDKAFVGVTGYLEPTSLWLVDAARNTASRVKSTPAKFDASNLVSELFEATSADGTRVPYSVVHRRDVPLDGSTPTLLYGYGGFEVSLLPAYSATVGKLWLERGGAYAVANTRGGGEFGPRWHEAAMRERRQRGHEDFQAVASDLIARGLTSARRLGVMGGSQGGLFMGVMLTQRPDLIHAAVISVPLFDMLRFHRLLAGASWVAEYGNPEVPEERAWIEAYSPYQQLRAGEPYPEVFINTSTKDDRVHPGHARRAAHRLLELGYPVLYYENTDGGHGGAANQNERAHLLALEYTYLMRRLMD